MRWIDQAMAKRAKLKTEEEANRKTWAVSAAKLKKAKAEREAAAGMKWFKKRVESRLPRGVLIVEEFPDLDSPVLRVDLGNGVQFDLKRYQRSADFDSGDSLNGAFIFEAGFGHDVSSMGNVRLGLDVFYSRVGDRYQGYLGKVELSPWGSTLRSALEEALLDALEKHNSNK